MKKVLFVIAYFTFFKNAVNAKYAEEKKIVCYFGGWAVYRNGNGKYEIPLTQSKLCTHLIYSFAGLGSDGTIKSLDPYADLAQDYGLNGFGKVQALKKDNPDLKVMIAMGGWNEGSTKYSNAVSNEKSRVKLATSIVDFLEKYGFNGFDFDWEYPNQRGGVPADIDNCNLFLKELKNKLAPKNLLLSIAVGATEKSATLSYNIPELAAIVDFINLMTYDYHGASWERQTGHVAPLYASPLESAQASKLNVDASVKYWIKNGAPPEKLILGVPFYGQSFKLADPTKNKILSPITGPGNAGPYTAQAGTLSYLEICELFKREPWVHEFEQNQRVPYSYHGDQWVGYDNPQSLTEKAKYIKNMNLGGAMAWSIESDDFRGVCGESFPLLKALNNVLRGTNFPSTGSISPSTTQMPSTHRPSSTSNAPSTYDLSSTTNAPSTNNPSSSTTTPDSGGVCERAGWFRDEEDCGKFYWCIESENGFDKLEYQCPAGLHFDTEYNVCNYPEAVKCNN